MYFNSDVLKSKDWVPRTTNRSFLRLEWDLLNCYTETQVVYKHNCTGFCSPTPYLKRQMRPFENSAVQPCFMFYIRLTRLMTMECWKEVGRVNTRTERPLQSGLVAVISSDIIMKVEEHLSNMDSAGSSLESPPQVRVCMRNMGSRSLIIHYACFKHCLSYIKPEKVIFDTTMA